MDPVDQYISNFSIGLQESMRRIRRIIKEAAPDAVESISYGMPAYKLNGKPLVYFAAFTKHIGFYALPAGHKKFAQELSRYKQGKGSVQFPLNEPVPFELIKKIVEFRVKENSKKSAK